MGVFSSLPFGRQVMSMSGDVVECVQNSAEGIFLVMLWFPFMGFLAPNCHYILHRTCKGVDYNSAIGPTARYSTSGNLTDRDVSGLSYAMLHKLVNHLKFEIHIALNMS